MKQALADTSVFNQRLQEDGYLGHNRDRRRRTGCRVYAARDRSRVPTKDDNRFSESRPRVFER